MATVEDCERALHTLAARLADRPLDGRDAGYERSLSCRLRDLDVTFAGKLNGGKLVNIRRADGERAQIGLDMTSDDLIRLVDGELNMGSAWATGRVKVQASMRDMLKLRSIF